MKISFFVIIISLWNFGEMNNIDIITPGNNTFTFQPTRTVTVCYKPRSDLVFNLWSTLIIRIFSSQTYSSSIVFNNSTAKSFFGSFRSLFRAWSGAPISGLTKYFLPPNSNSCVLLYFDDFVSNLEVSSDFLYFDIFLVSIFALGASIFRFSPQMSKFQLFYYFVGCFLACFLSMFFVFFVVFKLFYGEIKSLAYSAVLVSTFSAIFSNFYYSALLFLIKNYLELLISYILVICLLTSALIYYKGPVCDQKLINLVQWGAQIFGLFIIFMSTRSLLASIVLVLAVLGLNWSYVWNFTIFKSYKQNYISDEEYKEEGIIETQKAISDLRDFLRSDTKLAAQYLNRSQNKEIIRSFIDGDDHVPLSQALEYENEYGSRSSSDGEDEDEFVNEDSILTDDTHIDDQ